MCFMEHVGGKLHYPSKAAGFMSSSPRRITTFSSKNGSCALFQDDCNSLALEEINTESGLRGGDAEETPLSILRGHEMLRIKPFLFPGIGQSRLTQTIQGSKNQTLQTVVTFTAKGQSAAGKPWIPESTRTSVGIHQTLDSLM